MNAPTKIALGIAAATSVAGLALLGFRKRKQNAKMSYTAPDGNSYKENQVYKTKDNRYYKNGKEMHLPTPPADIEATQAKPQLNAFANAAAAHLDIHPVPVDYHQRGQRHH